MTPKSQSKFTAKTMTHSTLHSTFAEYLYRWDNCYAIEDTLNNPKKFLGPNYQAVLDFWWFIDESKFGAINKCFESYYSLDNYGEARETAHNAAVKAVGDTICGCVVAGISNKIFNLFVDATLELIGDVPNKYIYNFIMKQLVVTPPKNYSKAHQKFSEELKEPRALTNPEDFLGPNWEDVINFWLYVDGLNYDERKIIEKSYWTLDGDVREPAHFACYNAVYEVVGWEVRDAAWFANDWAIFGDATRELIADTNPKIAYNLIMNR
jgi:hypothetical protein